MLLAYPTLPATSKHDPHVPVPMHLFDMHQTMLWVKGFDVHIFPTPCELVRASLLIQHWEGRVKFRAYEPNRGIAAKPSRAALISSLRALDCDGMFTAYRSCVEDGDGIPEIEDEWAAIMRLCDSP